jgi:two-component system, cell cycle response regulator
MAGKILIVDGLATNRILLKVKLGAASHTVVQAATGAEAVRLAQEVMPALILMSAVLPDGTGAETCARLRADPATERVPVVLIGGATDTAARQAALMAGADEVLGKPLNEVALMARIRSLLRARQADLDLELRAETCRHLGLAETAPGFDLPPRVALVAPDAATALAWRTALAPHLSAGWEPMGPQAALAAAGLPGAPDLYLVAADLASAGDGLRLVADLRARTGGAGPGICLAMPNPYAEEAALGLDLGASAVAALPLDPAETALRLRRLHERQRRAELVRRAVQDGLQLAATDPLTGLWNRRYALAHLERIATRALAEGTGFAVMILDLDRFKAINDAHGHAAGDLVLTTVAARLQRALRPNDLLARIGGEEFLVALSEPGSDAARSVAERLCRAVAAAPVALPGLTDAGVVVTVSAGLALAAAGAGPEAAAAAGTRPEGGMAPCPAGAALARLALERADAALYAAKSEGRNQVVATAA